MDSVKIPIILIVDDNLQNLQYIADISGKMGYDYILCQDSRQIFDIISYDEPDIILLDVMMPNIDGYEISKRLKMDEQYKDIPVIFISAKNDIDEIVEGFKVGGVDYVTKPFNATILEARLKTHVELKMAQDILKNTITELEVLNKRLLSEKEKSEWLATRDYLTGIFNRRFMTDVMKNEVARCERNHTIASFIMIDIDNFKKVNDTYGHDCGDEAIKQTCICVESILRKQDTFSRWGGEEFLIMLPETDLEGAEIVAEKIRGAVEEMDLTYDGVNISITITLGISTCSNMSDLEAPPSTERTTACWKGREQEETGSSPESKIILSV